MGPGIKVVSRKRGGFDLCVFIVVAIYSSYSSEDPDNCGFDIFADVPDCINAAVVVTIPTNDYCEPMSSANVPPTTPPTAESQKITTAISSNHNDNSNSKVTNKRDSNANDIMLSPNLMRPAPSNPNNRFMNSVTAVYKSLSSCKVRLSNIESVSAQKAAAAAAVQADAAAAAAAASAIMASPSTPTTKAALRNSIESDDGNNSVAAVGLDDYATEIGGCVGELFEFEESEAPHVPLYTLRDEGAVKWAMLTDLCGMLKVKSKDTLLKQVHLPLFTV